MVLCALLIGLGANAQRRAHHQVHGNENNTELSAEQRATIQSKRLRLALGLDQQQQDQIAVLLKTRMDEHMERRDQLKSEGSPTKEHDGASRYTALNDRLDREIAFQDNLKSILSDSQFEQWRSLREGKLKGRKNRFRDRQRHNSRQH